ncbi:hypothetical protein CWS31_017235 [Colwellia echini]|uniref:Uncharacterized protein n=2 Tax=Colwellia echini TaxID=1982103 RepID=A0ABY3MSG6_9GAMM|nr:hypothetical protein CWS31_017235 [Colwellia echini]
MVLPQYADFINNNSSSRHALLSTITSYHLYEWVNCHKFTDSVFKIDYPNHEPLIELFEIARKITNGTKHFSSKVKTRTQSGFSSGFSSGFAKPLVITRTDGSEISADYLLKSLTDFWQEQYKTNGF